MNPLDVVLAARALRLGSALRRSSLRHRHLVKEPLALVLWQLGAEPFSAAALGWGRSHADLHEAVAGEPRNRQLAFAALLELARWFNPAFETPGLQRETIEQGGFETTIATAAPQVLVANKATVTMLQRLGRRLAFLSPDGEWAADPELIKLGRHLQFLAAHAKVPGQQLVVTASELTSAAWATPQSDVERQSLAALDAFIAPPRGLTAFGAVARAERLSVGPVPEGDEDERLDPLVARFNEVRDGATDPATVGPLLAPIRAHFAPLTKSTWDLLWRCRDREAAVAEAPSVTRRWEADREAYTRHLDWMAQNGRRRARQTVRQAMTTLQRLEGAQARLEAEEACDDRLRMVPYLLDHKAVLGRVLDLDRSHRERPGKREVSRPLLTLESADECLMPAGKELYWTEDAAGSGWELHDVRLERGRTLVRLKLGTSSKDALVPEVGSTACFSVHTTGSGYWMRLPPAQPWSHAPRLIEELQPIESNETAQPVGDPGGDQ